MGCLYMNYAERLAEILNRQNPCFTSQERRDIYRILEVLEFQNPIDVESTDTMESCCPVCFGIVKSYERFCDQCGQRLSWETRLGRKT